MNKHFVVSYFVRTHTRDVLLRSGVLPPHQTTVICDIIHLSIRAPYLMMTFYMPALYLLEALIWYLILCEPNTDISHWIFNYIQHVAIMFGYIATGVPPSFMVPASLIYPDKEATIKKIADHLEIGCDVLGTGGSFSVTIKHGMPARCVVFRHVLATLGLTDCVIIGEHPQHTQVIEFMHYFS